LIVFVGGVIQGGLLSLTDDIYTIDDQVTDTDLYIQSMIDDIQMTRWPDDIQTYTDLYRPIQTYTDLYRWPDDIQTYTYK